MPHVSQAVLRWVLPILALFAIGPLAAAPLRAVRAIDGSSHITVLLNAAPLAALAGLLLALLATAAWALISWRLTDAGTGLRSGGFVLAWAAFATGELPEALRLHSGGAGAGSAAGTSLGVVGSPLTAVVLLAIEGVLVAAAALVIAWPMIQAAAVEVGLRLPPAATAPTHRPTPRPNSPEANTAATGPVADRPGPVARARGLIVWTRAELPGLLTPDGLKAALVTAGVTLLIAAAIAFSPLRGQAFMAAVLGGFVGAAAARVAAPGLATGRASVLAPWVGLVIAAGVAPLLLIVVPGLGDLAARAQTHQLPRLGQLQPLDWAGGLLLGVDRGLGWGRSFTKQTAETATIALGRA